MSDILYEQPFTAYRAGVTTVVDHVVTAGAETTITGTGNFQPATGEEMQALGLSYRTHKALYLFTETELHPASQGRGGSEGRRADQVVYKGERYEVQGVEDFDSYAPTPHYEVLLVRLLP